MNKNIDKWYSNEKYYTDEFFSEVMGKTSKEVEGFFTHEAMVCEEQLKGYQYTTNTY